MEINIFQKSLAPKEEKVFSDYLEKKTPGIKALLSKFAYDAVLLKVTVEKFEKHDAFEVELCLMLPTKSLVAREASHQITKALDLSKDRLVAQLKKHMDSLRGERSHKGLKQEMPAEVNVEMEIPQD